MFRRASGVRASAERTSERAGLISARSNQMPGSPPDGFPSRRASGVRASAERTSERAGLISARSNQMPGSPPDGFPSGGANSSVAASGGAGRQKERRSAKKSPVLWKFLKIRLDKQRVYPYNTTGKAMLLALKEYPGLSRIHRREGNIDV